ncbi:sodium:calcium exchanger, partial [Candidatus Shapirobacteria bacterium]|nr:sodium:calcium exchanger [Candidatus Shapirobacteria bacterium]
MSSDFLLIAGLTVVLVIAFLGGFLARKIKQPAVVGYLIAGILISFLTNKFLQIKDLISLFSEIGIAFLMFTLGLGLSLDYLKRVKTVALWGGVIQILLVIILGVFLFPLFGFDFYTSLFMGCAFSLSSTAIVVKILSEKGEVETLPGEIMLGWLLVQDLAVLPMVAVLPTLSAGQNFSVLLLSVVKAVFVLAAVWFLGRNLVPKFIAWVADFGSRELLLIAVVALCLLTAILTSALGLSLALGAFLAGLVVAKTSENHAIFAEVRPLRDLFSIVFFVSLGIFLNPYFFASHLLTVLGLTALVIFFKFLIVTALVFYLGYHIKTALIVGMGLIQVGEFAFILSRIGFNAGLIGENDHSLILSVALLTILITPWFMVLAPKFYFALQRLTKRFPKVHQKL